MSRAGVPDEPDSVLATVHAHVAAFNAGDVEGVVALFADDAVFSTGQDVLVGRRAIHALFRDAFAAPFQARLELHAAVVQGRTAACELTERLTFGDTTHLLALAAFYTVHDGRLARVKVYREGTAEAPRAADSQPRPRPGTRRL